MRYNPQLARLLAGGALVAVAWTIAACEKAETGADTAAAGDAIVLRTGTGQKGGTLDPSKVTPCEPLPEHGGGTNSGIPVGSTDAAWLAYADTLCFVESAGEGDDPASHFEGKGKANVVLWILPERHGFRLNHNVFNSVGTARIVARVWNAHPWPLEFAEWKLKHGGSMYLWVGREQGSSAPVVKVIRFDPDGTMHDVHTTGVFQFYPDPQANPTHARARWGRHARRVQRIIDSIRTAAGDVKDHHNSGCFECTSGWCGALGLW